MRFVVLLLGLASAGACGHATVGDVGDGGLGRPDAGPGIDGGRDVTDAGVSDCVPGVEQLLLNPSFDDGPVNWSQTGGTLIVADVDVPVTTESGSYAARMLSLNNADQVLAQEVDIPAYTSRLELSMQRCWVTVDGSGTDDRVAIELRESNGTLVETFATVTNADATARCNWSALELVAAEPHPGQRLSFRFRGTSDGASYTTLYFDTLALTSVVTCQ